MKKISLALFSFFGIIVLMFMTDVIYKLNFYLKDNDTVIVGVSGGPDSMCLLSLIMQLNKKINIICAHVDHGVRKESEDEYIYIENFCKENGLTFEGIKIRVDSNNFEDAARKKRYTFYNELKNKYHAKYIMTAHHGDDLIETILMRITRGSNLSGYAGIKELEGYYLRVLLSVTKDDIISYLDNKNIKYYWDKTNDEDYHTRNRYRHSILPALKKENVNVHLKYLKFSKELSDYQNFVEEEISRRQIITNSIINIPKFQEQSLFLQKKTLELLIKSVQKDYHFEVSDNLVASLIHFINSSKVNSKMLLTESLHAIKSYDEFKIAIEKPISKNALEFANYYEDDHILIKVATENESKSNFVLRLDSDEIKMPLYLRTREVGDTMELKNLGHKKIKDIFIDLKLPFEKRDELLMLVDSDNNILWLPGYKKSKFDKEKNQKYDIILLCERKK